MSNNFFKFSSGTKVVRGTKGGFRIFRRRRWEWCATKRRRQTTTRRRRDDDETTTRRRRDDNETATRQWRDYDKTTTTRDDNETTTRRHDDDETTTRRWRCTEEATGGTWMDSIVDTGELRSDNTAGGAETTRFLCKYVISNNETH